MRRWLLPLLLALVALVVKDAAAGYPFAYPVGTWSATSALGQIADVNSIVWGDIAQPEIPAYTGFPLTIAPQVEAFVSTVTTPDGYANAVLVNPDAVATPLSQHIYFTVPPLTTAMQIHVIAQLPAGVASTTIVDQILTAAGGGPVATNTCTLNGTWQDCTPGPTALVAGTTYQLAILYNQGASVGVPAAEALISRVFVTPTATTNPALAAPFVRYHALSNYFFDNIVNTITEQNGAGIQGVFRQTSPGARLVFWTNAEAIGVQTFNNDQTSVADTGQVFANGKPVAGGAFLGPLNVYGLTNIALPKTAQGTAQMNYVEVVVGGGDTNFADYVTGIVAPQSSFFQFEKPQHSSAHYVFYGDSICNGYGATLPVVGGLIGQLRGRLQGEVTNDCEDGKGLFPQASSAAAIATLTASIMRDDPVAVIMEIGRNDWNGSYQSLTAYTATHGATLDSFHAAKPNTFIFVQPWTLSSVGNEASTNLNGNTQAQYRAAEVANCNAPQRTSYCTVIPANTPGVIDQSTDLFDGTHLNNAGAAKYASFVITYLDSVNYGTNPPFPNSSQIGCPGNAPCITSGTMTLVATDNFNDGLLCDPSNVSTCFVQAANNVTMGTSNGTIIDVLGSLQLVQALADGTTTTLGGPITTSSGGASLLERDEFWGRVHSVSSAAPQNVMLYNVPLGSGVHTMTRVVCRAVTAPAGGSIGDTWATNVEVGVRNVGGTATLVGSLTPQTGSPFTDASMAGTSLAASVSTNQFVLQVTNVATATVDCEANIVAVVD